LLDGNQLLRVSHLQQAELKMETLLLLVSEFAMRTQHDLQVTREIFLAEHLGHASDTLAFFAGNLQEGRIFARDFCHRGVA
jgi:hypothetical protein